MQNVSQNSLENPNEMKNASVLKEANHLFGEPVIESLE